MIQNRLFNLLLEDREAMAQLKSDPLFLLLEQKVNASLSTGTPDTFAPEMAAQLLGFNMGVKYVFDQLHSLGSYTPPLDESEVMEEMALFDDDVESDSTFEDLAEE